MRGSSSDASATFASADAKVKIAGKRGWRQNGEFSLGLAALARGGKAALSIDSSADYYGYMSADSDNLDYEVRSLPNRLRLRSWPPRDGGWACWLLPPAVAAVCVVVGRTTDWWLAAAVGVVQILALWRWFLPASFELNELGVHQRVLGRRRRIPWSAIGDYRVLRRGVLLLPDAQQRPLDSLRGLYLPWRESRFEMLGLLEKHLRARGATQARILSE